MDVDWDLHAVVRACCSAAATTASAATSDTHNHQKSTPEEQNVKKSTLQEQSFMGFPSSSSSPNLYPSRSEHLLHDLYSPLNFQKLQKTPPSSQNLPISPLSVLGGLQDPSHPQKQQGKQKQQSFGVSRCTTSHAQSTRSKKRKNQMKRVCQVPAEGLSSDMWSWRKYGQKPIKGSPYPRGYYRCSTLKGCLARKQVERNRSDPDMFIVTYTGEHSHPIPTHRNSLAGSTRHKPTTSGDENKPSSSPPLSPPAALSPATEKTEDNDREVTDDDDFFFEGLDDLVGPSTGDAFSDHSPVAPPSPSASQPFPWMSNHATTAAGGV